MLRNRRLRKTPLSGRVDSATLFSYSFLIAAPAKRRHADHMKHLFPLVLLTAIAAAGCNTQTADNSTSPTTPTTPTITEPAFTGTLSASQNGGQNNVYTFSVAQVGPLTVTLTAAGPPSGVGIGLAIGTPTFSTTGTTCSPIATNSNAQVGVNAPQISGTVSAAGPYCLAVFGIPPITADLTYSVTVAHT
jgi:hypothetical protein